MSAEILLQIGEALQVPLHLAVHELPGGEIEIVAIRTESGWSDAFPLPLDLQSAAAEVEIILDTSTVARLELRQFPGEFWDDQVTLKVENSLTVTLLGRSAQKYLRVYRAIRTENIEIISNHEWTPVELARVAKWLRVERLFDHRSGAIIMAALTV